MARITRREMLLTAAAGSAWASGLPAAMRVAQVAAPATEFDPFDLIDPELREPLRAQMREFNELPNQENLARLRARAATWEHRLPPPAPQPRQVAIPAGGSTPELTALVFDPSPGKSGKPALLHTHGGGYVLGSASMNTAVLQDCARNCGCVIVAPNYRLAPETKFPGSLEDNYAALRWLYRNAESLGVDRSRIAVGGESAGGGHAAMLALAARDRAEMPLVFQLLIYPMLDDRTGSTNRAPLHIGRFVWTEEANRFGWTSLLGVPAGSRAVPEGAVPARAENLAGLPPTFIAVGALDLFAAENIEYARRLLLAGVPTELHVIPGAYHGFDVFAPEASVTLAFKRTWQQALRRALGVTGEAES